MSADGGVAPGAGAQVPLGVLVALDGDLETAATQAVDADPDMVVVRRCADVAELLSVAEAGLAAVVVMSGGFGRVDTDTVARLRRFGCRVIGLVDPDRDNSDRIRATGVDAVVEMSSMDPTSGAAALIVALRAPGPGPLAAPGRAGTAGAPAAVATDWFIPLDSDAPPATDTPPGADAPPASDTPFASPGSTAGATAFSDPLAGPPAPRRRALREAVADPPHPPGAGHDVPDRDGTVITVWGAAGAPGRTVTAVTIASELAADGAQVLLIDADTHAASVASYLGVLDESSGIVAAVRAAIEGRLRRAVIEAAAPLVMPRLRVLTGITRSARWSELRPAGFEALLAVARQSFDVVVVDVAAPVERDEELSFDVAAPRRNALTLLAIERADALLAVGSADPIGLARLVRALQELQALQTGPPPTVVANRVRASAVGDAPQRRVSEALARFGGITDPVLIPDDRPSLDRAVLAGRCLLEAAPASVIRAPLRQLAGRLTGRDLATGRPLAGRRGRSTR